MNIKDVKLKKGMNREEVNKLIEQWVKLEDDIYLGMDYKHNWRCLECKNEIFTRMWRGLRENRIICEKCRSKRLSGSDFRKIKLLKGISKCDVNELIGKWLRLEDDVYLGANYKHNWIYNSGKRRVATWADIKNKAVIKLDKENNEYISERAEYCKSELIKLLELYYKINNKVPTIRDIIKCEYMPSKSAFGNAFGSFKEALVSSGLFKYTNKSHFKMEISDDDIIDNTRIIIEKNLQNKKIITIDDINKSDTLPKYSRVYNVFDAKNGIESIYGHFGYNVKDLKRNFLLNELSNDLIKLSLKLGRTPSSRDIDKYCKTKEIHNSSLYIKEFGSLYDAYIYCNIKPTTQSISLKISNDDLIKMIQDLADKLGRTPTCLELEEYGIPSRSLFAKRFGGFNNALKIAGLEPTKRVFKSKNGNEFKSMVEAKFANMLESNNIIYNSETYYKDVISGFKRKYRFDFDLEIENKKVYIEIFGIQNNEFYNNRKLEKIKICKLNNINLLYFDWYDVNNLSENELYIKFIKTFKQTF